MLGESAVVRGSLFFRERDGALANFGGGEMGAGGQLFALEKAGHFLIVTRKIHERLAYPDRDSRRLHREAMGAHPMREQGARVGA